MEKHSHCVTVSVAKQDIHWMINNRYGNCILYVLAIVVAKLKA